ncbi:MAG: hypothetical protein JST02_05280 [Bacteroidetes bacterium]|nr:hypothetical protein [Bacteroidota bacterium]
MRTKTIPGLFRILIPFLLLLLLFSCKKTDTGAIESNTEKFFNIKNNVSFETLRCIAELKRQNEITGFIEDLVKQSGFAYWDNALVNRKAVSNAPSFSSSQVQGGDTLVFIPLVKENENYVDGFLFFRINGIIEVHLYRNNDFDKFPYGSMNSEILKSEKVVQMLLKLDESIFGKRKFNLFDTELFKSDLIQNDSIQNVPKSVEYNRDMLNFEWMSVCFDSYHCHGCPPNQCDLCPLCYSIECVSLPVLVGGSGGGNEWPAEPPTGGSGGGGSNPCPTCPPPNQNCTPNGNCVIGTQIIEGRLPCGGCGNGPIVILPPEYNYGLNLVGDFPVPTTNLQWANSIDITGLVGHPCLENAAMTVINSNAFCEVLKNFLGIMPIGQIKIIVDDNPNPPGPGKTMPGSPNMPTVIHLYSKLLEHSTKSYALMTIIHEILHAEFDRIMLRAGFDQSARDTYQKLINYLHHARHDEVLDHEYMQLYYVPFFKNALQEVDFALGLTPHYKPNSNPPAIEVEYYDALAWSGLDEGPIWEQLGAYLTNLYGSILNRELYQGNGCN